MATITANTFLDGETARTAGESWTMNNGSVLTIRTDTRWHLNSPASMTGSIGATTISAIQGGGIVIDATAVRWLAFDNGDTGKVVPAIDSEMIGSVAGVGIFLGIWASLTSAPTAVGAAMPGTGFIKFKSVSSAFVDNEQLTVGANLLCTANGADVTGWIEVVQDRAVANTVPRLGSFTTRGNWFYLANTTGVAGQVVQLPTNGGGAGTHVPGVWIETGAGENSYEFYPAVLNALNITANFGTDARSKFVETLGDGQIRIGHNGTTNVGFVPAENCKIRIPNILMRQCATATRSANAAPHATIADRPDWTTTSAGVIDIEYALSDWYYLFTSPFKVTLKHGATFDIISTSNNASPLTIEDFHVGNHLGGLASLTISANSLGGVVTNCKFYRTTAASGGYALSLATSDGIIFNNCEFGVIAYARHASGYAVYVNQSLNIKFINCKTINQQFYFNTSFDCTITNLDYTDRIVGTTNTTTALSVVSAFASSNNIVVDGVTFGRNGAFANTHPYTGVFAAQNSSNLTFRNLGTAEFPISGGSANQVGVIYTDSGVNTNVRVQRCYLTATRTNLYTTSNTSKGLLVQDCVGTVGAIVTAALNAESRGVRAASASVTGQASVYGTHFFNMFTGDIAGQIWFAFNEPTTFNHTLVTNTFVPGTGAGFTSGGQAAMRNIGDSVTFTTPYFVKGYTAFTASGLSPVVTGTNPANFNYTYEIDKGSGFGSVKNLMKVKIRSSGGSSGTNTVTVASTGSSMPEAGDLVLTEAGAQIPAGTTVTDVTGNVITLSANFTTSFTGTLYFMKALPEEVISPSTGFRLRVTSTTATAAADNALTYIRLQTTTTLADQRINMYPLDYSTISISGFVPNSRVYLYDITNAQILFNQIVAGTSMSFSAPYVSDYLCNVRIMYEDETKAYLLEEFSDTVTINGLSRSVNQTLDTVYGTNGVSGESVTGVIVNYVTDRIELYGSVSWAEIYARRTYRLYQEDGIHEKDSDTFIYAVDTANYRLSQFKLLNMSSPSVPVAVTGGWAVDFYTGRSVDTVDNTGGTIFSMPDHVIPFAVSGGSGLTPTESSALLSINPKLAVINNGIKNASLLVPHTTDV